MSEESAEKFGLKPGQKLCQKCERKCEEKLQPSSEASAEEFEDAGLTRDTLNESVQFMGVSPLKPVSQRDKPTYGKRKVKDIETAAKSHVATALEIPRDILISTALEEACEGCKDLNKLLDLLKEKCKDATQQEKIKILTLTPESWTIQNVVNEFGVTEHAVKKARTLKREKGILADPDDHKGRPLDSAIKERVVSFYQLDDYSRMCPGKKEYVSVRIDGKKEQKQKRLLLTNLKELHIEYLSKIGDKISFSKFCELRPKWCVSVTSSGMHSVCVCQYHQNAKLLAAAVPGNNNYRDLLEKTVCQVENRNCMLHYCDSCPGKEGLNEYLLQVFSACDVDAEDNINFKQWVHTDRTTLVSQQLPMNEFITQVCTAFHELRHHHFVSKAQANFLNELKECLQDDAAIVLLDFAENYSFVIQDAVQGHYWDNSQATLHPFVVYSKCASGTETSSFCIISDSLKHDTVAVHAFITTLLKHIKETKPQTRKIFYFSDGAASQYKNYKNLSNLCHHEQDYGLPAEWHFFATSHGKSPCDGIGGTVKRLVARASLQATVENQILSVEEMYKWATGNIQGIHFFYVTSEDIQQNASVFNLEHRFSTAKTVVGTRSHHSFIPLSSTQMEMRRISADQICTSVYMGAEADKPADQGMQGEAGTPWSAGLSLYQPGRYVACVYDAQWYIGNIIQRNEDEQDVYVNFMKQGKENTFSWPPENRKDQCWVPFHHIICAVEAPLMTQQSGRQYKLAEGDYRKLITENLLKNSE